MQDSIVDGESAAVVAAGGDDQIAHVYGSFKGLIVNALVWRQMNLDCGCARTGDCSSSLCDLLGIERRVDEDCQLGFCADIAKLELMTEGIERFPYDHAC